MGALRLFVVLLLIGGALSLQSEPAAVVAEDIVAATPLDDVTSSSTLQVTVTLNANISTPLRLVVSITGSANVFATLDVAYDEVIDINAAAYQYAKLLLDAPGLYYTEVAVVSENLTLAITACYLDVANVTSIQLLTLNEVFARNNSCVNDSSSSSNNSSNEDSSSDDSDNSSSNDNYNVCNYYDDDNNDYNATYISGNYQLCDPSLGIMGNQECKSFSVQAWYRDDYGKTFDYAYAQIAMYYNSGEIKKFATLNVDKNGHRNFSIIIPYPVLKFQMNILASSPAFNLRTGGSIGDLHDLQFNCPWHDAKGGVQTYDCNTVGGSYVAPATAWGIVYPYIDWFVNTLGYDTTNKQGNIWFGDAVDGVYVTRNVISMTPALVKVPSAIGYQLAKWFIYLLSNKDPSFALPSKLSAICNSDFTYTEQQYFQEGYCVAFAQLAVSELAGKPMTLFSWVSGFEPVDVETYVCYDAPLSTDTDAGRVAAILYDLYDKRDDCSNLTKEAGRYKYCDVNYGYTISPANVLIGSFYPSVPQLVADYKINIQQLYSSGPTLIGAHYAFKYNYDTTGTVIITHSVFICPYTDGSVIYYVETNKALHACSNAVDPDLGIAITDYITNEELIAVGTSVTVSDTCGSNKYSYVDKPAINLDYRAVSVTVRDGQTITLRYSDREQIVMYSA